MYRSKFQCDGVPVCVAHRLTLPVVLVFMLILAIVPSYINSLLCYDRQALLRIKFSADTLVKFDLNGHKTPPPALLSDVPAHLLRAEVLLPRRRHRRRQGNRGSLVKIKAYLVLRENQRHCYHQSPHDATCHCLFSWHVSWYLARTCCLPG